MQDDLTRGRSYIKKRIITILLSLTFVISSLNPQTTVWAEPDVVQTEVQDNEIENTEYDADVPLEDGEASSDTEKIADPDSDTISKSEESVNGDDTQETAIEGDSIEETAIEEDNEESEPDDPPYVDEAFSIYTYDSDGKELKSFYSDADDRYYLFLPNNVDISSLVLHYSGSVSEVSTGSIDAENQTIVSAFSASGDKISVTLGDDTVLVVEVMQSSLPSMHISLSDDTSLEIINAGSKDIKYSGNSVSLSDLAGNNLESDGVEIKGRGNTTWVLPDKKGYQIKFSKKTSVLGMDKAKKWVLLANSFDDSLLRNAAAFDLARAIGMDYIPEYAFIDLWIDSEYIGNYMLCEKVEIGSGRVELTNETGVLMELDNAFYGEEDYFLKNGATGAMFALKEIVTEGMEETAMNQFDAAMTAFYKYITETASDQITVADLGQYVDVESLAQYYLMTEFTLNCESYSTSFYWYMDGPDDVLHVGPVWDFDSSFGTITDNNLVDLRKTDSYYAEYALFYKYLIKCPAFIEVVNEIYQNYNSQFAALNENVLVKGQTLMESAAMNYIRWDYLGKVNQKPTLTAFASTYENAVSNLAAWIENRYNDFVPGSYTFAGIYYGSNGLITIKLMDHGYSAVSFPIWSETNGQDDIKWLSANKNSDGYWEANVSIYEFKHLGQFVIHAYAVPVSGSSLQCIGGTFVSALTYPGISAESVVNTEQNTLTVSLKDVLDFQNIQIAVWGAVNGQNDLNWYIMSEKEKGVWTYSVDLLNHMETGIYNIHIYGVDSAGNLIFLGGLTETIDSIASASIMAECQGGYMKIVLYNSSVYNNIKIAVWTTENGQDDLKWYDAINDNSGNCYYYVDLSEHGTGTYIIHIYDMSSKIVLIMDAESVVTDSEMNVDKLSTIYKGDNYSAVYNYDYYINNNGLEMYSKDEAIAYFVTVGMLQGQYASPEFNVYAYRSNYADLQMAFGNDLKSYYMHYIDYGKLEGRNATVYTAWRSGVSYNLIFDAEYYVTNYPDLKAAFGSNYDALFDHFLDYGMKEGRQAIDGFAVYKYMEYYQDLQEAFGSDLPAYYLHYITYGYNEGRIAA